MSNFIAQAEADELVVMLNQQGERIVLPRNKGLVLEDVLGTQVRLRTEPKSVFFETSIPTTSSVVRCVLEMDDQGLRMSRSDVPTSKNQFDNLEDFVGQILVSLNSGL